MATLTLELIRDFGVLAGHSLELRGFSTELDALLDLVAKGWKKVTEERKPENYGSPLTDDIHRFSS